MPAGATVAPTIAQELEVRRLQHRAARLRKAIVALEDRRLFREQSDGHAPAPLRAALADFRDELAGVERRLQALGRRDARREAGAVRTRPALQSG